MSEKKNNKRLDFQKKMISRQSEQINDLKLQIENLKLKCEEKDEIINSVTPMKNELADEIKKYKKLKNEFEELTKELKKMKEIMNQTVYKNKWSLVKFLIK